MKIDDETPLSVRDWPVTPGQPLSGDALERYRATRSRWCGDRRNGWYCSCDPDHALPHVGVGHARVVAVWDQQWFGDVDFARPVPTTAVPLLERISTRRYREATGSSTDADNPF